MSNLERHIRNLVRTITLICTFLPAFVAAQAGLENPLNSQFCSVPAFVTAALKELDIVALPIFPLFIVVSGFMFVLARGNEQALSKAKENFIYVIIGALLILGAWLIATLIGGTVTQLVGN